MRKADLVATISEKTGVPKVDVLVTLRKEPRKLVVISRRTKQSKFRNTSFLPLSQQKYLLSRWKKM